MQTVQDDKPDRIVMEGYSLNMKHASSVIPLVELGGLLRFMLHLDGFKWYDPRATEVKKFVTGKGNSPKDGGDDARAQALGAHQHDEQHRRRFRLRRHGLSPGQRPGGRDDGDAIDRRRDEGAGKLVQVTAFSHCN